MSSALVYYAKQPQFLPAKACSWVSRDQRLLRKFKQARSPPLLFRGGGTTGQFLTTGSRRFSSRAAPILCTITVQHCCSSKLTGCSVLAQTTPSLGEKGKVDMPLAGETPARQPTPTGSELPLHKPLWQPSSPSPPACLHVLPISDSQMSVINTEKGRY